MAARRPRRVTHRGGRRARPDWRDSSAFSGEFDPIEGNETRPLTGSTAHLVRFRASAGRKPRGTDGRPGEGGVKTLIALFYV